MREPIITVTLEQNLGPIGRLLRVMPSAMFDQMMVEIVAEVDAMSDRLLVIQAGYHEKLKEITSTPVVTLHPKTDVNT